MSLRSCGLRLLLEKGPGNYGETIRTVSANANLTLGRAALEAAIKQDPKSGWMLLYPGGVAGFPFFVFCSATTP